MVTSVGFFEAWGLPSPSENDPGGSPRAAEPGPNAQKTLREGPQEPPGPSSLGAPGRLLSRFGRLLGRSEALLAALARLLVLASPERLLERSWRRRSRVWPKSWKSWTVQRWWWFLRPPGASWGILAAAWGARTASWHDRSSEHVVLGRQSGQFARRLKRKSSVCSTVRAKTSVPGPSEPARPRANQVTASRKVV